LALLCAVLAAATMWGGWRCRLAADEGAFHERATVIAGTRSVAFHDAPDAASLRYFERIPGRWRVILESNRTSAAWTLRTPRFSNVSSLEFYGDIDADPWLKELSAPGNSLKAFPHLSLCGTITTDAGIGSLAQTGTALASLVSLDLEWTRISDEGLRQLARPDTGLKALKKLNLRGTSITDAGLASLARPDCGLTHLVEINVFETRVSGAGAAALAAAKPGLRVE